MTSFAEITGLVDRAQNPDALLTDGARALTGNLSVADGITIDGVDISAFQSAYQAHLANPVAHSYVRNILDDASAAVDRGALTNDVRIYGADGISVTKTSTGLRISGSSGGGGGGSTFAGIKDPSGAAAVPDGFNYISLTVSNQVSITASTNALAFALVPGNINHQDLGGRGADDHHAAFVGLKVGATTVNPDGSDVITIAAGTNATVVAGSNTVTIGVSSTPAFTSVTVSGNISVGGTVDGVDISTHAANADAHHNQGHVLATNAGLGADHTISGATAGHVLRASSATAAAFAAIQDGDLPSTIVRTSRQIVSGNGLTGGGNLSADRTLAVGAGAGITVNGDDVALTTPGSLTATSTNSASGNHTHAIDSTIARSAITISAGNGLSGGGDLTANRTIALSTPGSLSATSTNSSSGSHTHVIDSTIARSAITISAGNGMSGGGNLTANRTLAVNQDYDFNWTGLHTFNEHTEMESVDVNGALTVFDDLSVFHGGFYPLFVNVDTVNPNNSNVGIMTNSPDPQFALDVAGPLRAQYLIGPHAIQLSDAAMICHFDGPYPFETNYDGFAAGHKGQVGTETGGVIYRPGKFGKAVQLAEATTNLVTNPSFETNTTGWSTTSTNTIARSTAQALYGEYSCEMTIGASRTDNAVLFQSRTLADAAHALTSWIYIPSSSGVTSVEMRLEGYVGATVTNASTSTKGQWVRLTAHITPSSSDLSGNIVFRVNGSAGSVAYADGIQLEQKAYATSYCDGSLGSGHTWAGTAHASTSSRTAAQLYYATPMQGNIGTVFGWFKPTVRKNYRPATTNYQSLFECHYGGNGPLLTLQYTSASDAYLLLYGLTSGPLGLSSSWTPDAEQWTFFAVTWDGSNVTLYGGKEGDESLSSNTSLQLPGRTFSNDVFRVGNWNNGFVFNGLIDDLVILSRAADAAEIRSIYESDAPVFAESSIEVWRTPTQVPIWVDSEGLWMRSVGGGETLGAYGGAATKSWGGKTLYQSDFLLGNATNGYIHWHAFQNPADPWGEAGMEVKAEMDIIGNSTVSGSLGVTGEFSVADGTLKLFVTQEYLLAGNAAGVDETSFAVIFANGTIVGTSPSSPTYDAGDVLIGDELNTNILWDQSAGRMNFRNGTTVEAYVDDGAIVAGAGDVRLDTDGITIIATQLSGPSTRVEWKSGATTAAYVSALHDAGYTVAGTIVDNFAHGWFEVRANGSQGGKVTLMASAGGAGSFGDPNVFGAALILSDNGAQEKIEMNCRVDLTATNAAMILNRLTTTQRNALFAIPGMIIYNSTDQKVQARTSSAWVNLH